MDHNERKALKGRASQALGQGWQSMAVKPAHVLELTRAYKPREPAELEKENAALLEQHRLQDRRVRDLERRLKDAHDTAFAEGAAVHMDEIKRLRAELAPFVLAEDAEVRAARLASVGRKREVGIPA